MIGNTLELAQRIEQLTPDVLPLAQEALSSITDPNYVQPGWRQARDEELKAYETYMNPHTGGGRHLHTVSQTTFRNRLDLEGPYRPESFGYGNAAVTLASLLLQAEVNQTAGSGDPQADTRIKTDARGATSPVTQYDEKTEQLINGLYTDTNVRILGEEGLGSWSKDRPPTLDIHLDPIDGTALFMRYLTELTEWLQLPFKGRPLRPACGSMVSAGAVRPGSTQPEWGVIAAPFLHTSGIVRWYVNGEDTALRIAADSNQQALSPADAHPVPQSGGIVLVSSDSTERAFGTPLRNAGYEVVKYPSAVASALCVMDQELPDRLGLHLKGEPIVGAVMYTAKNWDVAASVAIANSLGYSVSGIDGQPRTFQENEEGAIFAVEESVNQRLAEVMGSSKT